jgi:hypothetical protein
MARQEKTLSIALIIIGLVFIGGLLPLTLLWPLPSSGSSS